MNVRVIRRALGLFLADIVIIIGIFLLQFRTDSTIIEKLGNLQITLSESQTDKNISILKNKLQVSYNGLNFYCDDQNPLKISYTDREDFSILPLTSWEKYDELGYVFQFEDDVKLYFSLADTSADSKLSILAVVPENTQALYLPYNSSYTMKIVSEDAECVVLNDKKNSWAIQANSLTDGFVTFGNENFAAVYGIYSEEEKFSFTSMVASLSPDRPAYETIVKSFSDTLISSFKATSESSYTEQSIVAYIAAMAEQNKYKAAIDEIPQSFKKSDKRTYLSAPYFNSLEKMDATLDKSLASIAASISKSSDTGSLDIFTATNIGAYMSIHSKPSEVYRIISNVLNANLSECSIAQITGIMSVFNEFYKINLEYAARLKPLMDICVKRIEDNCTFDGEKIVISENGIFVSVAQGVETGIALLRYSLNTNNQIYARAGQVIVESYLSDISSFDLRTLTALYPIICYDNWYYPHFEKLAVDNEKWIWAWTCAKNISYDRESGADNTATINIDFPLEYTHYVIFKGIPAFKSIYIYNMAFRTDPRFETYNSSGYVYKSGTKTLLYKSRHKSEKETVRFILSE